MHAAEKLTSFVELEAAAVRAEPNCLDKRAQIFYVAIRISIRRRTLPLLSSSSLADPQFRINLAGKSKETYEKSINTSKYRRCDGGIGVNGSMPDHR